MIMAGAMCRGGRGQALLIVRRSHSPHPTLEDSLHAAPRAGHPPLPAPALAQPESAQRTHTEEFYEVTHSLSLEIAALNPELQ